MSQAREILKSPNERVRQELLRIVVENGATVSALRTIRADYDLRAGSITQQEADNILNPESPPPREYVIECPCCRQKVGVNSIYLLSVCKVCHDGILAGIEEGERSRGGQS